MFVGIAWLEKRRVTLKMSLKKDIQELLDREDKWMNENNAYVDPGEWEYHVGRYNMAEEILEIVKAKEPKPIYVEYYLSRGLTCNYCNKIFDVGRADPDKNFYICRECENNAIK